MCNNKTCRIWNQDLHDIQPQRPHQGCFERVPEAMSKSDSLEPWLMVARSDGGSANCQGASGTAAENDNISNTR